MIKSGHKVITQGPARGVRVMSREPIRTIRGASTTQPVSLWRAKRVVKGVGECVQVPPCPLSFTCRQRHGMRKRCSERHRFSSTAAPSLLSTPGDKLISAPDRHPGQVASGGDQVLRSAPQYPLALPALQNR